MPTANSPAAPVQPAFPLTPNLSAAHTPQAFPADPYAAERATVAAVRRLLAGARPRDLPQPPHGYGRWAEKVGELCAAWADGGTPAVEDLHVATATSDPVYCTLLCGDLPPEIEVEAASVWMGKSPEDRGWTIRELLAAESEPVEFVIDGLIPVGVTNIAGRPKIGKSWFTLQLFAAADAGQPFLGFPTVPSARGAAQTAGAANAAADAAGRPTLQACYLALEDSKNRLIDRLKKVTAGMNLDLTQAGGSTLRTHCAPLSADGLVQVRRILEGGCRLLIIDTFSRFLGRGDQMDQQEMTLALGTLQRLAFEHHAAIVVVDHHRKCARTSLDADPIDDILGATAKAGVVDCAIGLYRRHNQNEAALKLCGRDFGDSEIALEWDPDAFRWTRKAIDSRRSSKPEWTLREREAIDAVGDLGHATLKELTDYLGGDRSNLYTRLQTLCRRGALDCVQTARGYEYVIPTLAAAEPAAAVAAHAADETSLRSELGEGHLVVVGDAGHAASERDERDGAAHAPVVPVVAVVDAAPVADKAADATAGADLLDSPDLVKRQPQQARRLQQPQQAQLRERVRG